MVLVEYFCLLLVCGNGVVDVVWEPGRIYSFVVVLSRYMLLRARMSLNSLEVFVSKEIASNVVSIYSVVRV